MNILFLDIDGVLNSGRSFCATESKPFHEWVFASVDPISVALVNRAVREQNLKIVVSSSHRSKFLKPNSHYDHDGPGEIERMVRPHVDLPELQAYMAKFGIIPETVIDATPQIHYPGSRRGVEIQYWLDRHPWDQYAILDDDSDMLPEQLDRFVHTTNRDGITFDCFIKLEGLFGGRKPKIRIPERKTDDK